MPHIMNDRSELSKAIHDVQCHAWLTGQRQFCQDHPNAGHLAAADAALAWHAPTKPVVDVTPAAQQAIADAYTHHPGNRNGTPESRAPISRELAATAVKALAAAGYVITTAP